VSDGRRLFKVSYKNGTGVSLRARGRNLEHDSPTKKTDHKRRVEDCQQKKRNYPSHFLKNRESAKLLHAFSEAKKKRIKKLPSLVHQTKGKK